MASRDGNGHDHANDQYGPDDEEKVTKNTRMLFSVLKNEPLPADEKEQIWNRIMNYVQSDEQRGKEKSFNRFFRYQAVAAVALLFLAGLGYYKFRENTEDAMQQAAALAVSTSQNTQLLLADQRTINLKGENSDVIYQKEVIRADSQVIAKQLASVAQSGLNTLVVPFGKRSAITLPDGTKIWLNSGSKLVYPTDFQKGKREVFLEGQAYFSVAHDAESPFYVQTRNMNVKVLGTEFDVSSYDDDSQAYTVLAEGSIELATEKGSLFGSKKTRMVPGTRASYSGKSNHIEISNINVGDYVSWKEGYLVFTKTPLSEILKKLSRYYKYDLSVSNEQIGQETFSGTLDLKENIDHVMDVIATTTSLSYHKTERRIILEKGATKE